MWHRIDGCRKQSLSVQPHPRWENTYYVIENDDDDDDDDDKEYRIDSYFEVFILSCCKLRHF